MNIIKSLMLFLNTIYLILVPVPTYTEGVIGQPQSFLPHQAQNQTDKTISRLIYRGLFRYDIFGNLTTDLAESWKVSADGTVYTITLKDNQFWSDGSRITADDLIYTAFKSPSLQGVGTDKVDDRTVRYILPNKFSPFLSLLTGGVMKIDSEENFNKLRPVSSGKFKVLQVKKSGPITQEVVLYNNSSDDEIKKIIFRYYSNESELVTAAKLGEIDAFMANSTHDIQNFENYKFPQQGVYFAMFFNLQDEGVQDIELRKNLQKSLDIEKIIFDKGIFVQGPISRSAFTNEELEFDTYDEDFSADLANLSLTLTIPDLDNHIDIADRVEEVWEDTLDLELKIEEREADSFIEDVITTRDYQILLYGQEIGRDPDRYINWHSTQIDPPGLNLSAFSQVRVDRALEEGRNELELRERVKHYEQVQQVIVDEVPAIFLYHPYKNFYVNERITGIGEKYTFTVSDRFLDFENWEKMVVN